MSTLPAVPEYCRCTPTEVVPFLQNPVIDVLQPDLINSGGITGTKMIADLAALYRVPICLHNVSGLLLNMASQQFTAATFNSPMMECTRRADQIRWMDPNPLEIKDGYMTVSTRPFDSVLSPRPTGRTFPGTGSASTRYPNECLHTAGRCGP